MYAYTYRCDLYRTMSKKSSRNDIYRHDVMFVMIHDEVGRRGQRARKKKDDEICLCF